MRIAAPVGQPPTGYTVDALTVDGITTRRVECLHPACHDVMDGSDHWAFGVVDEHTHIAALCANLADLCEESRCPVRNGFGRRTR